MRALEQAAEMAPLLALVEPGDALAHRRETVAFLERQQLPLEPVLPEVAPVLAVDLAAALEQLAQRGHPGLADQDLLLQLAQRAVDVAQALGGALHHLFEDRDPLEQVLVERDLLLRPAVENLVVLVGEVARDHQQLVAAKLAVLGLERVWDGCRPGRKTWRASLPPPSAPPWRGAFPHRPRGRAIPLEWGSARPPPSGAAAPPAGRAAPPQGRLPESLADSRLGRSFSEYRRRTAPQPRSHDERQSGRIRRPPGQPPRRAGVARPGRRPGRRLRHPGRLHGPLPLSRPAAGEGLALRGRDPRAGGRRRPGLRDPGRRQGQRHPPGRQDSPPPTSSPSARPARTSAARSTGSRRTTASSAPATTASSSPAARRSAGRPARPDRRCRNSPSRSTRACFSWRSRWPSWRWAKGRILTPARRPGCRGCGGCDGSGGCGDAATSAPAGAPLPIVGGPDGRSRLDRRTAADRPRPAPRADQRAGAQPHEALVLRARRHARLPLRGADRHRHPARRLLPALGRRGLRIGALHLRAGRRTAGCCAASTNGAPP